MEKIIEIKRQKDRQTFVHTERQIEKDRGEDKQTQIETDTQGQARRQKKIDR